MHLRTTIEKKKSPSLQINYADSILMLGSCFTEHLGKWLKDRFWNILLNPFGIQYNPLSMANGLQRLLSNKAYQEQELFLHQRQFHHFDFHSSHSGKDPVEVTSTLNEQLEKGRNQLVRSNLLFITWGTAWVYELQDSGEVVNNCHKMPDSHFTRRRLSVDEIVTHWLALLTQLKTLNPKLQVVFTVSPIRHTKDTLHGNQVSKATLLLAIEELQDKLPEYLHYFPSYEILMDDLRDYRFYNDNLTHPSTLAIQYIQQYFMESYFPSNTLELWNACDKIAKNLSHRPNDPKSDTYLLFLEQNITKLKELAKKHTCFDPRAAIQSIHSLIQSR